MHTQIYLKAEKLSASELPVVQAGETLLGIVFTHGFTSDGKEVYFAFPRVKRSDNKIVVIENYDPSLAACPYPPPCNQVSMLNNLSGDCYAGE